MSILNLLSLKNLINESDEKREIWVWSLSIRYLFLYNLAIAESKSGVPKTKKPFLFKILLILFNKYSGFFMCSMTWYKVTKSNFELIDKVFLFRLTFSTSPYLDAICKAWLSLSIPNKYFFFFENCERI